MTYVPAVEELIPIHLPYETVQAQVIGLIDNDTIIAKLIARPFGKNHDYREDDWVKCERKPGPIAGDRWEAVTRMEKPEKAPEAPKGKRRERK